MRGADELSTRHPDLAMEPVGAEANLPQGGSDSVRLSPRVVAFADESLGSDPLASQRTCCFEGRPLNLDLKCLSVVTFREAPLTHEVALATEDVVLVHSDPADRLLAATAKVYGLTLIAADENLIRG